LAAAGSGRPHAQAPASESVEVRRRGVARRVQQPPIPLVETSPAEAIVHRAVRHCSFEEIGESGGE
jgi:hypothetical protein